jgi:hypothetical protein
MPRNVPTKLTSADLPIELSPEVEAVLEVDRLFWLDPNNKNLRQFERAFVAGEALPKQLPEKRTRVIVQRWGRTFLVDGVTTLIIEDNEPRAKLPKAKRDHGVADALTQFRQFMGEYSRQVDEERSRRLAVRPSAEERRAQSEADKQRHTDLRERNRLRRAAIGRSKGNRDS